MVGGWDWGGGGVGVRYVVSLNYVYLHQMMQFVYIGFVLRVTKISNQCHG